MEKENRFVVAGDGRGDRTWVATRKRQNKGDLCGDRSVLDGVGGGGYWKLRM